MDLRLSSDGVLNSSYDTHHQMCANCGKKPAYMHGSKWCHNELVCSDACGERLHRRILNGMVDSSKYRMWNTHTALGHGKTHVDSDKVAALRLRIKQLEHRVNKITNYNLALRSCLVNEVNESFRAAFSPTRILSPSECGIAINRMET